MLRYLGTIKSLNIKFSANDEDQKLIFELAGVLRMLKISKSEQHNPKYHKYAKTYNLLYAGHKTKSRSIEGIDLKCLQQLIKWLGDEKEKYNIFAQLKEAGILVHGKYTKAPLNNEEKYYQQKKDELVQYINDNLYNVLTITRKGKLYYSMESILEVFKITKSSISDMPLITCKYDPITKDYYITRITVTNIVNYLKVEH